MGIDWIKRFKSKAFWAGMVSVFILAAQVLGFELPDGLNETLVQFINAAFALIVALGISVDTSSPGLSDK